MDLHGRCIIIIANLLIPDDDYLNLIELDSSSFLIKKLIAIDFGVELISGSTNRRDFYSIFYILFNLEGLVCFGRTRALFLNHYF